jgi:hypothetical protein
MYNADFAVIRGDLIALAVGAVVTCVAAGLLLQTNED